MTPEIQITSFTPRSFKSGRGSVLANFDVKLVGLMVIEGCTQFADTTVTKETRHLRGEKGFTSAKVHDRPGLLGKGRAGK